MTVSDFVKTKTEYEAIPVPEELNGRLTETLARGQREARRRRRRIICSAPPPRPLCCACLPPSTSALRLPRPCRACRWWARCFASLHSASTPTTAAITALKLPCRKSRTATLLPRWMTAWHR